MNYNKSSIFILGAGSHGIVVADNFTSNNEKIYFLDDKKDLLEKKIYEKISVIGSIENIDLFKNRIDSIILGLGETYLNERRILFKKLKLNYKFTNSIHNTSIISRSAKIGNGIFIGASVYIGANVTISDNTVIYPGTVIEHGTKIEENVYISPNVCIAGNVIVKKNVFLGIGVNIIPKLTIEEGSFIAAGSLVIENTSKNKRYMGVPARIK